MEAVAADVADVPLVVDLDGTLARTDTLHEAILSLVANNPVNLFRLSGWLKEGKAAFKSKIASEALVGADTLPLNEAVVALVREARAEGRRTALVSASDERQVAMVAEATGLFDEFHGSDGTRNLGGEAKAAMLVERFGEGGFDYVGDAKVDLAVWTRARRAITVGVSDTLRAEVDSIDTEAQHLVADRPTGTGAAKRYLKAMRPHQWLKNLLVFAPAAAAHDMAAMVPSFFAFLAFSLAASSVYLINDMLDLPADRNHPRKCRRPFAAGDIPVTGGVIAAGALVGTSLIIAALTSLGFLAVLIGYLILTTAYSMDLKRRAIVDIWTLGALYTTRIVAGGVAAGVELSTWFLAFSMFLFLSLAAVKRQSEIKDLAKRGGNWIAGRGYRVDDLPVVLAIALASGYCSVLVLALYISSEKVAQFYGVPELLWCVCALLLYWVGRMTLISHRGDMDDDPIVFALKDKVSIGVVGFAMLLVVASTVL
ncbi:MAG: UbiA family prenyltransferase [Pseudomonadota bacterium]